MIGSNVLNNHFSKFQQHNYPYNKPIANEDTPFSYWSKLSCITETTPLAKIAVKILGFPQSGAVSVERTFSSLHRIHTWQRSQIGREKLSKLVFIYYNRRQQLLYKK